MTETTTRTRPVLAGPVVLPRVNLLPPEIEEQRHFRRVQGGLAGAVLAAFGVVGVLYLGATGAVSDATEKVDAASARQQSLSASIAGYRTVTQLYKREADSQAMLVTAMSQEVRYSRLLNDLSLTLPKDVWVTNLTFDQSSPVAALPGTTGGLGKVTITGVADEHGDVALWLEALREQAGYVDPLLQTSNEVLLGSRTVVDYTIQVTLSPDALSGRTTATTTTTTGG